MLAQPCVLLEVGVIKQDGEFTLWIVGSHPGQAFVGLLCVAPAGIDEEEVIPHFVHFLEGGVVARQPYELLL